MMKAEDEWPQEGQQRYQKVEKMKAGPMRKAEDG